MRLNIETMGYGFDAIAHDETGKTVFVEGGVPGDVVEAKVTSSQKSFSHARIDRVVEPSPHRTQPLCPYASVCGGCPWSNMDYDQQLISKRKNVADALERIGHMAPERVQTLLGDIVSSDNAWGYRNKIELIAIESARGLQLGMHRRAGRDLVAIDRCLLLPKAAQKLPRSVGGALRFMASHRALGIERVGMRYSERTRALEVALWTDPAAFPRNEVAKVLEDAVHPTSTVRVLMKGEKAARHVTRVERLAGKGMWNERIAKGEMKLSAPSFFQVNTAGAEHLIDLVLKGLSPTEDEIACDLYCGAGTFTLPLAAHTDAVIAVESYGPAVRDLKRNVADHHLDERVECIGDDAAYAVDVLDEADVVVVDPPRAGLDRSVIEALNDSTARAVAYVSCDPATLARDLAIFEELGGLSPVSITPVDLFPQTFHVETVTILKRADENR